MVKLISSNYSIYVALFYYNFIDEGTHSKLIKNDGIYSKYYKLQQSVEDILKNHEQLNEIKNLKVEEFDSDKQDESDKLICSDELIQDNDILQNTKQMGSFEVLMHLIKYNKPIYYVVIAILGAFIIGAITPLMQPLNVKFVYKLMKPDHHDNWKKIWKYFSALMALAIIVFIVQSFSKYFFRRLWDSLTLLLRSNTYKSLVNQSIEFFDKSENSTGNIVSTLSSEIRHLNGASIALYILWIQGIAALLWGETVMFIYSWKIGVYVGAILPLGMIAFVVQFQIQFIPQNTLNNNQQWFPIR